LDSRGGRNISSPARTTFGFQFGSTFSCMSRVYSFTRSWIRAL